VLAARFGVPTRRDIYRRLVAGAAVFGFGWGLAGLCPGPALTSIASGRVEILAFVVAMTAGMWLYGVWEKAQAKAARVREERAAAEAQSAAGAASAARSLVPTVAHERT